ncbi:MAG: AsnC family transcriptional regulator [Nanoarchaeota archaeon]
MEITLNQKTRQILHCLDTDARMPFSEIAKRTRQSQETVRYTINRLKEEKIISGTITVINIQALGYIPLQILLKFQFLHEKKKEEIIAQVREMPAVNWIGNLEGNYDLGIILSMKDYAQLHQLTGDIYRACGEHLMKKRISINLEGNYLPRDYLTNKERHTTKTADYAPTTFVSIDDVDKRILHALAKDARTSVVEIAKQTHMTPTAVIHRMKRLKENNIITKHLLLLNQEKLGQEHYKILLFTNNQDKIISIIQKAYANKNVIAIIKTLAEWDLEIDLEVMSRQEVTRFMMGLSAEFSTIIRDYDILRIRDMPKYNFYPEKQTLNTTIADKRKRSNICLAPSKREMENLKVLRPRRGRPRNGQEGRTEGVST